MNKSNNFDWGLNESLANDSILKSFSKKCNKVLNSTNIEKTIEFSFKFARHVIKSNYKTLNKIHNKKLDLKTYEFLLLPWCFEVVSHSNLLWQLIDITKGKKIKVNQVDVSDILSSQDNFKCSSYLTNYWLLSEILKYKKIKYKKLKQLYKETSRISSKKNYKNFFKKTLNYLRYFTSPKFIIWDTGLTFVQELILNLKLGQLPINYDEYEVVLKNYDYELRKKISFKRRNDRKRNFNNFFFEIFPAILPIEFLESFEELFNYIKDFNYKNKFNRKIFTQSIHINSKRAMLAKLIQNRSKLIILQHGGGYGVAKLSPGEILERHLADKFLSWGWIDNKKKVSKFINVQSSQSSYFENIKNKKIVMFFTTGSNFFDKIGFWPIVNFQRIIKNYNFKKILTFVNKDLKKKLVLRYHARGFKRSGIEMNKSFFGKSLEYDEAKINWKKNFSKNSITIHENINGTTWLDTISHDVPTLILDDKKIYKTRKEFQNYYLQLKKNKIIFTDPKKLAFFLNQNFYKINEWWSSKKISKLKKKIVLTYSNISSKPTEDIKNFLNS